MARMCVVIAVAICMASCVYADKEREFLRFEEELEVYEAATLDAGAMIYTLEGDDQTDVFANATTNLSDLMLSFRRRSSVFLDTVEDTKRAARFHKRLVQIFRRQDATNDILFERLRRKTAGIRLGHEQEILGFLHKHRH